MSKEGDPFQFPTGVPPIPDHLSGPVRDLFIRIVDEMADARVKIRPVDCIIIEMLASQLAVIRRARAESRVRTAAEAAKLYEQIILKLRAQAVDTGKECMLSEEAVKRVLWEQ